MKFPGGNETGYRALRGGCGCRRSIRTYANQRRLPRRNHYQEGPGFLFVATQGGRPPEDALQRAQAAIVRRRRGALRRWADGEPVSAICADLGCSRASLFRWRARYAADGLTGLVDQPRVGRASELPETLERLILTVRLLTYWNSRRIAAEFRRRGVWPLSHGQVDRLLARHGTHRPSYIRTPGPRYERAAVNELWHIDLKGPLLPARRDGEGAYVPGDPPPVFREAVVDQGDRPPYRPRPQHGPARFRPPGRGARLPARDKVDPLWSFWWAEQGIARTATWSWLGEGGEVVAAAVAI